MKLQNDGRTFERFFNDFNKVFNFCGGSAVNLFFPVDYHLTAGDKVFWFETKEMHSFNHVYSIKFTERDEHLNKQINFLAAIQKKSTRAGFLVWVEHWHKLGIKSPFIFMDGKLLKFFNDSKDPRKFIHLNSKGVKPFSFYGLLAQTPRFEKVFQNIMPHERPYITPYFPNIFDYCNPKYSVWKEFKLS